MYMATIRNVIIHHAGGAGANDFASTRHHTFETINSYHAERWRDSAPTWQAYRSRLGYHAGYNVLYDPKTRVFKQARMLGEETAAARGRNFDSFHLCIIGNNNKKPNSQGPVDPMQQFMLEDIVAYLYDLINGNTRGVQVAPGTTLNFSIARVYPHREFSNTMCYGTALPDTYFRDQLTKYRSTGKDALKLENDKLKERNVLLQMYLRWYVRAYNQLKSRDLAGRYDDWREDPERIDQS